jgi:hypothetical protein
MSSRSGHFRPRLPTAPFVDEGGDARAHERAPEASEARMAERSGRAVNGGQEGRRERPASGHGYSRPADFTERPGFVPGFPGAERHKAKVCDVLLVLIGGFLPPGGAAAGPGFTERPGVLRHPLLTRAGVPVPARGLGMQAVKP